MRQRVNVVAGLHNRWVSLAELRRGTTVDNCTIATQVLRMVKLSGVIQMPESRGSFKSRRNDNEPK